MKAKFSFAKRLFLLLALAAAVGPLLVTQAQTFRTLYNFTGGSDGGEPMSALVISSNTLYGTTTYGPNLTKTLFSIHTDGTGFRVLHQFAPGSDPALFSLSGNSLYGASSSETGTNAVFKVNTDGTEFKVILETPIYGCALSGNVVYGIAEDPFYEAVSKVNVDGTGFTNLIKLHPLTSGVGTPALVLSDGMLYGVKQGIFINGGYIGDAFGLEGAAAAFGISTDGSAFNDLHIFTNVLTNSRDGIPPLSNLVLGGNTLYGAAASGGISGNGTLFAVNTDGSGFRVLHNFTGGEGSAPLAGLTLSGQTLYGSASQGGTYGNGTIFQINTAGTGFAVLHDFTAADPMWNTNSDGASPITSLILSGNTLYGTTPYRGYAVGTIFSISLQPQLAMTTTGLNFVLSWPTNFTGYTLQSTANLVSSPWTTNLPVRVVINGQNTVTYPISGTQQFFRLSQ
jgi:uncharacterized repeat protein (TIGR03803 family)